MPLQLAVLLTLVAAMFVVFCYPVYVIAKRLETEPPWLAFVPLANLALLAGLASDSREPSLGRGALLWSVLEIPYINLFALAAVWANVSVNTGRSALWGWLTIVPVLNLMLYWVIAWRALPRTARVPVDHAL